MAWMLVGWGTAWMVGLMAVLWGIYRKTDNASFVDFGWAFGLAGLAGLYAWQGDGDVHRRLLIGLMGGLWGLRLAFHILIRILEDKKEDPRYTQIRENWKGANVPRKFFFFFQLQAVLDVVLAIPFLCMSLDPRPGMHPLEFVGLGLWVIALAGEALADYQLKVFRADPSHKGKTCEAGLWNYSRHPNYFFEWLIWVAYFVAALASPYGWLSLLGPVVMFYFLTQVTGIPLTEERALKTRGDDYRRYQRTTSAFVPWFKKKG